MASMLVALILFMNISQALTDPFISIESRDRCASGASMGTCPPLASALR